MQTDREIRTRPVGTVKCIRCHQPVKLTEETDEWVKQDGAWVHGGYGPASGECERCEIAYVEQPLDGCVMAFDLKSGD